MQIQIPCVILCGGRSSRMGQPKQNLDFFGTPLAHFQAKRLKSIFTQLYFSSKATIANPYGVETIIDMQKDSNNLKDRDNFSPLFGIQRALEMLKSDIFILSIDAPFFSKESILKLKDSFLQTAVFAKNSKIHPLLGIYPFNALEIIKQQIAKKEYKLLYLLDKIQANFITIPEQDTQNLNTYQEYINALKNINT